MARSSGVTHRNDQLDRIRPQAFSGYWGDWTRLCSFYSGAEFRNLQERDLQIEHGGTPDGLL